MESLSVRQKNVRRRVVVRLARAISLASITVVPAIKYQFAPQILNFASSVTNVIGAETVLRMEAAAELWEGKPLVTQIFKAVKG
jgi:hypothetical protein